MKIEILNIYRFNTVHLYIYPPACLYIKFTNMSLHQIHQSKIQITESSCFNNISAENSILKEYNRPCVAVFQRSDNFLMETLKASTIPPKGGSNTMAILSCGQPVINSVNEFTEASPSKKWWLNMLYLAKLLEPYNCIWN